MYFLALSQAPPALAIMIAIRTPVTRAPPSSPPKASVPSKSPIASGDNTAITPGTIICLRAAAVEISTHLA